VDILAGAGHAVVVHFDKKAPAVQQQTVRALEQAYPGKVHVVSKVHCVWGEWSLVEAVLVALREFDRMPDKPDYIHLMSGSDFPIRPIADLEEFLRRNPDKDFIECCDITKRRWVKGGLSMERFRFFFPVNFRTSRKTFDRIVRWHRKLHIRRKIPFGMTPHMGSQWWTLRWHTCATILGFLDKNPKVIRYFLLPNRARPSHPAPRNRRPATHPPSSHAHRSPVRCLSRPPSVDPQAAAFFRPQGRSFRARRHRGTRPRPPPSDSPALPSRPRPRSCPRVDRS
jgi:hypothetical protein